MSQLSSQRHSYWGEFTTVNLPNAAGSPNTSTQLRVGDTVFDSTTGTLKVCTTATIGAAVWAAIGTAGAAPTITTGPLDLYVSDIGGNDANDGLAPGSAFKTLTKAELVIPDVIDETTHRVIVHIGMHGGAGYSPPLCRARVMRAPIYWYGDGAGQGGETGFTVVLADASVATTNANQVTASVVLVVNAHLGRTIRMTSGVASGQYRTIRDNTAAVITVVRPFSPAPAAGDTYDIVDPTVVISFPLVGSSSGETLLVNGSGTPSGGHNFPTKTPATWFVNQRWTGATGALAIINSKVVFIGVSSTDASVRPLIRASQSFLGLGEEIADISGTGVPSPVTDLGIATPLTWHGWGLAYRGASTGASIGFRNSVVARGFLVCPAFSVLNTGFVVLSGGNIFGTGSAALPTIDVDSGGVLGLTGISGTPILVGDTNAVALLRSRNLGTTNNLSQVTFTNLGGPVLRAEQLGMISGIAGSASGTGTTFGALSATGGGIYFGGTVPAILGPAGSDLSVDGIAGAGLAAATLAATGDSISNALDGSRIQRTA